MAGHIKYGQSSIYAVDVGWNRAAYRVVDLLLAALVGFDLVVALDFLAGGTACEKSA